MQIFEIVPGAAESPVILHVPHASREVPPDARADLLVTDAELAEELDHLTDAHTDVLARLAAQSATARPWIFEHRRSRLVVDPERFPDDREEMRAVGMGAVYTHGFAGRKLRDDDRVREEAALQAHFRPYSASLAALVAQRIAVCGRVTVLDVHSYATLALPYEMKAGCRPPVCLGTDPFHTPPGLILAATRAFGEVALNTPFAGCYVPLEFYGSDRRVSALMVEIRRDGYMVEPGGPPTDGLERLALALAEVVDAAERWVPGP